MRPYLLVFHNLADVHSYLACHERLCLLVVVSNYDNQLILRDPVQSLHYLGCRS